MEKLLIYKDTSSNKFWKVAVTGKSYTVTYGKIGSVGAVKTKEFDSESLCLKEAEKLISSKLKKGYISADSSENVMKESTMNEAHFWELIDSAKSKEGDLDEQVEWLSLHLSRKPVKDIVMFDYHFNQHYRKSYTSDLWAAAFIIMGGASDDCFDYFRAWLLYQGKEAYEKIIQDPESVIPYLIPLEEDEEIPQLEEFLSVADMAYEEKTGLDYDHYYSLYENITGDHFIHPEIEFDWDDEDEASLKNKFPLLWERYGENPLE